MTLEEFLMMYQVKDPLTGELLSALDFPGSEAGTKKQLAKVEADKSREEIIKALRKQRGARASQKLRLDPLSQSKGVEFRELQAAMRDPLGLEPFDPTPSIPEDPAIGESKKSTVTRPTPSKLASMRTKKVMGGLSAPEFLELAYGKPAHESLFTPDIGVTAHEMKKGLGQGSTKDILKKGMRNAKKALQHMLPVDNDTLVQLIDPKSNTFTESELRVLSKLDDGELVRKFIVGKMRRSPESPLGMLFSSVAKGPPFIDETGTVMFDEPGFEIPRKEFERRYVSGTGVKEPYMGTVREPIEDVQRVYEQEAFDKARGQAGTSEAASKKTLMSALTGESKPETGRKKKAMKFPSVDVGGKKVGTKRLWQALQASKELTPEEVESLKAAILQDRGENAIPMAESEVARAVQRRTLAGKLGIPEKLLDPIEAELNAPAVAAGQDPMSIEAKLRKIAQSRERAGLEKIGEPLTAEARTQAKLAAREKMLSQPLRTKPLAESLGSAKRPLSLTDELAKIFGGKTPGSLVTKETPELLAMLKEESALAKLASGAGKTLPLLFLAVILADMLGGSDG